MKRLGLVVGVLVVALVGALFVRAAIDGPEDPLVVVHWSNSHPMREGLLPDDGRAVQRRGPRDGVRPADRDRGRLVRLGGCRPTDLVARRRRVPAGRGGCEDDGEPARRRPDDRDAAVGRLAGRHQPRRRSRRRRPRPPRESIAETCLGIVTYRDDGRVPRMAGRASSATPTSSSSAPTRRAGQRIPDCAADPIVGTTSRCSPSPTPTRRRAAATCSSRCTRCARRTSRRRELTVDDIERPEVVESVQDFQQLVDHYMPGTHPAEHEDRPGHRRRATSS